MPIILFLVLIGTAAGLVATRLMRMDTDLLTAAALGIAGAGLGWLVLRFVLALSGWLLVVLAATLGAIGLIWLWKNFVR
ncbi:MAG: GlsB/YeaQ/YmgE family stress response membrane protein [Paracoccaceae bacterium]